MLDRRRLDADHRAAHRREVGEVALDERGRVPFPAHPAAPEVRMLHARDVTRPEVDAHRIPRFSVQYEVAVLHRDEIARRVGSLRQHGELVCDHVVAQAHGHAAGRVARTQRRRTRHRHAVHQRAAPHDAPFRVAHLRLGGGRGAVPVCAYPYRLAGEIRKLVRTRAVQPRFTHEPRNHLCHTDASLVDGRAGARPSRGRVAACCDRHSRQPARGLPRPPFEQHPLGGALAAHRITYGPERDEAPADALPESLAERTRHGAQLAGHAHRLVPRVHAVLFGHFHLRHGTHAREGVATGTEVAEVNGSGTSGHHRRV